MNEGYCICCGSRTEDTIEYYDLKDNFVTREFFCNSCRVESWVEQVNDSNHPMYSKEYWG